MEETIDLNETWCLDSKTPLNDEAREDELSFISLDKTREPEKEENKNVSFDLSNEINEIDFADISTLGLRRSERIKKENK